MPEYCISDAGENLTVLELFRKCFLGDVSVIYHNEIIIF